MWIKICGVTRAEDVSTVACSGANAIGFNFFAGSKRYVSIEHARSLIQVAKNNAGDTPPLDLVGVFVNSEAQDVQTTVKETGVSVIQIHGDETEEQIAEIHRLCPDIPLVRAVRVHSKNLERTLEEIDRLCAMVPLAAILLDAFVPGEFGGTGKSLDLSVLQTYAAQLRPRLILAGGLTPENSAKMTLHPIVWGADTASGVESSPGIKDAIRVRKFVDNVRQATSVASEQRTDFPNRRISLRNLNSRNQRRYPANGLAGE
jgi:phosphoribosylanthranilate isomerase